MRTLLVAAGPVGRNAEASGTASIKNVAAVYSYSKTRGLFAGVSFEGSVIVERFDANKKMYGRKVKCSDLLNGNIPPPEGAESLYRALEIKTNFGAGGVFSNESNGGSRSRSYSGGSSSFNNEYGGGYNNNENGSSYNNTSDAPAPNRARSFSRGAVHNLAKHGGTMMSTTYNDENRARGNSVSSSYKNYDSPKQITSSSHYNDNDNTFGDSNTISRSLALTHKSNSSEMRARALFNFKGEQPGDLVFHKGDIITITKKTDTQNDWWTGKLNEREGIVSELPECN